jgi:hypothetical protein
MKNTVLDTWERNLRSENTYFFESFQSDADPVDLVLLRDVLAAAVNEGCGLAGALERVLELEVRGRSRRRVRAASPAPTTEGDLESTESGRLARKYPGDTPLPVEPLVFKQRKRRPEKQQAQSVGELFERGRALVAVR